MAPLKTNFRVTSRIEAFYTGGKILVSSDGSHIFCTHGDAVNILDAQTGKRLHCIKDEGADEVTCFAVTGDDEILVVAYRNSLLKQWDWKEERCTRTWQSLHRGPVVSMAFDVTSTLLATGSSDSTIKLWDILQQYCTHNLKGSQGVVSLVKFHPDSTKLHLFSVSDDNHIRVWDLQTSRCISVLSSHYGAVTGLAISPDGNSLVSSGRDSVVVIWDLDSGQAKKTIPVFEPLEAVIIMPNDMKFPFIKSEKVKGDFLLMTAGAKGGLKVWSSSGQCLHEQKGSPLEAFRRQAHLSEDNDDAPTIITDALLCAKAGWVTVVTYDHNIILFGLEDLKLKKQFVGYNEEVLDLRLMGKNETHLAVASNSEQIRVFDLGTGGCQILTGHTDIVLALDVFKKGLLLVSSSKDNTVRLWSMNADTNMVTCVGIGSGHTHSVGTVAAARLSSKFCVSGSEDCTLKVWRIPEIDKDEGNLKEPVHLKVSFTEKAHDKDINSVCISPNDKLLATGSQDRVAKLWHLEQDTLLGTFRGHRRGIWCVQFSPTDQALATSSADGSIRIWALSNFSCVKTFEGHDASVLKVIFLTRGMQLMSSGSDGLLKLWTIKTNECVTTLDEHSDKVWSVTSNKSESKLITAGADSNILIWEDVTQIEFEEKAEKEEDQILKEQQLSNLIHSKKYTKALRLAITLDQPFRALGIIKTILEEASGEEKLRDTLAKLRPDQIEAILRFARTWNTNSKHCHVAQTVINVIMSNTDPDDLVQYPGIRETLEGLLPYTERHFQRLTRLVQQSMFVQYTWQVMRRAAGDQVLSEEQATTLGAAQAVGAFFLDQSGQKMGDEIEDEEEEQVEEEEGKDQEEMEEEDSDDEIEERTKVSKKSKMEERIVDSKIEEEIEDEEADEEVENSGDEDEEDIEGMTTLSQKSRASLTKSTKVRTPSKMKDLKPQTKGFLTKTKDKDTPKKGLKPKTSTDGSVKSRTDQVDEVEDESARRAMKRVLTRPVPVSESSSDEDDSDEDNEDERNCKKDATSLKKNEKEKEDDGGDKDDEDEEYGDNDFLDKRKLNGMKNLGSSKARSKKMKTTGKKKRGKDDNANNNDDVDDPPSPITRTTRQSSKSKDAVKVGRGSKRKGTIKAAVLASGTPAKKSSPSPYTKKLRRPSRK